MKGGAELSFALRQISFVGLLLLIHLYLFAQLTFLKCLPKIGKEDRQQIRKHPYHTLYLNKDLLFSSQEKTGS